MGGWGPLTMLKEGGREGTGSFLKLGTSSGSSGKEEGTSVGCDEGA